MDTAAYASIASILHCPAESPLKKAASSISGFAEYCDRMRTLVRPPPFPHHI
jgi:hypothetical protein